ncbi:unnamed protein product [Candidula unifasciata]|uniref:Metalloendopeptidase n=1 Tax=Candidula unifasciata TaxID=100452 RepID=A0A8S4A3Y2_9EUPU|nr:unnamed protein product [Candidula unifasciata]
MTPMAFKTLRVFSIVLMLHLCYQSTSGRTIDEMIASSSNKMTSFDMIEDEHVTVLRLELDMLMTVDQYLALYGKPNLLNSANSKTPTRNKRKAIKNLNTRWTNKRIPYRIAPSTFSNTDNAEIMQAIGEWEKYTCINFQPATISDSNFVNFEDGSGCSSYIGMIRGKQSVSLAGGCRFKGIIAHEIGHAVGFFHEQNRPDRDDYVIIKKENILHPDVYDNFKKYDWSAVSSYDVPYDYKSIMHYGGTAFSGNGKNTIVTIDPAYQNVIGNREGLSFNDIKLANLMYNCNETCSSSIRCPKEGFLGKDCQCWCAGDPVRICDSSSVKPTARPTIRPTARPTARPTLRPTVRPTTEIINCKDRNPNCPSWQKSGFCLSSNYVKTFCQASCRMCEGDRQTPSQCKDFRNYCPAWGKRGYCSGTMATFMRSYCPATCGACNKRTLVPEMAIGTKVGSTVDTGVDGNSGSVNNGGFASSSLSFFATLLCMLISFVDML